MKKQSGLRLLLGLLTGRSRIIDRDWHGVEEADLLEAIENNVNCNDRVLYNLLGCYRILVWLCARADVDLRDKSILEIGTSRLPGLPLTLLLNGCREYYATNVFRVDDHVSESYARVLQLIMCGCMPIEAEEVDALLEWRDRDGERIGVMKAEGFKNLSPCPAEEIDLPSASIDVAFSFSVFEHLSRPAAVLANTYRLLKPGGLLISGIDLRDHRDFSRPLEFLRLSRAEYQQACPAGENRLRATDFRELFGAAGFREEWLGFLDTPLGCCPVGPRIKPRRSPARSARSGPSGSSARWRRGSILLSGRLCTRTFDNAHSKSCPSWPCAPSIESRRPPLSALRLSLARAEERGRRSGSPRSRAAASPRGL